MNILSRIFCSNPFSFAIGLGAGLVGFYIVHRVEEQRKLETMQKDIEGAVRALESGKLKVVDDQPTKSKK